MGSKAGVAAPVGALPHDHPPVFPWIEKTLPPVTADAWARASYGPLASAAQVGACIMILRLTIMVA